MFSNTRRARCADLLFINSASRQLFLTLLYLLRPCNRARIWMKYIPVFHSYEQLALPKFAPGEFVASSKNKLSIRVKLSNDL